VRSSHGRLRDIVEAIDRIERFVPITADELINNEERQVWFVHHLQIIGEAARVLPESIRAQMPAVPWRQWVGLRHILVHEYFGVDVPAVHNAVNNDLAVLLKAVEGWLAANPEP